jgi:phage/plasmid-like protein (TIGR03299 family)
MAHNLNKKNGVWSFVARGELAWHGLGQYVGEAMTAEQAIKLGGLDYEVEKRSIFSNKPSGIIEIPDYYSTIRTDTNQPLGIVGKRYKIVQNKDAFVFFDSIIEAGEAIFETAGALGNGERIFVTAKLPGDMLVRGEEIDKYILLTNSHDGSSSVIAGFTNVRVVCNNTLQAALGKLDNKVSISHTSSAETNLKEAYKVMGIASRYMDEVNKVFEDMTSYKLTDLDITNYIQNVLKDNKKEEEEEDVEVKEDSTRFKNVVGSIFNFSINAETQKSEAAYRTLWGAYNAISGYYTHIKDYRTEEQKMWDINYGTASSKIKKAFNAAKAMMY